jgi:hypothetical protein
MKNIEQYRRRFNMLIESSMGDVRPLISEQDSSKDTETEQSKLQKKIIELTNQSLIPQELVDNPETPVGFFDSNKGTRDDKGQFMDITDEKGVTYRIRNWGNMNLAGHSTKGVITAAYNSDLAKTQKTNDGETVESFFEDGWGSEIVPNNNMKWIGFVSDNRSIRFACFEDVSGKLTCKTYEYKIKQ